MAAPLLRIDITPLGEALVDVATPPRGSSSAVRFGALGGTEAAFKSAGTAVSLYHGQYTGLQTSIWGGGTDRVQVLPAERRLAEALLVLEHEALRAAGPAWNHRVLGLGIWDLDWFLGTGDAKNGLPALAPVLVSARAPARPFASLPRATQRDLFPRILPGVLRALAAAPHGDLSGENLLVDTRSGAITLIDPGVTWRSRRPYTPPAHTGRWDWQDATMWTVGLHLQAAFSTTAAAYPIAPPQHPLPVGAPWAEHVESLREALGTGPALQGRTAAAADHMALGILYFQALTGRHPFPAYEAQPLWSGLFGEQANRSPDLRFLTRIKTELPSPADFASVRPEEAELCRALLTMQAI